MHCLPLTILLDDPDAARMVRNVAARLTGFRPGGTCPAGLVVMELGPDPGAGLARAERMLSRPEVADVVLAGPPDPQVLMRAMRAGVQEFLALPLDETAVDAALQRFLDRAGDCRGDGSGDRRGNRAGTGQGGRGSLVYVLGGKGGVGATSVAVNTAVELAMDMGAGDRPDRQAALVDLRMPLGEVPLFLDLEHDYTWAEAVRDPSRLDATFVQSLMVRHSSGLFVLPAPNQFLDSASLTVDAAEPLFRLLRSRFAATVVDGSDALDEATMRIMGMADHILLVIVLSLPCLANARKLLDTFDAVDAFDTDAVRLVVNRHLSKAEISVADAEELLGRTVHATVPNDYETTLSAINQGAPLRQAAPKARVTAAMAELARSLDLSGTRPANSGQGLLARLLPRRRERDSLPGLRTTQIPLLSDQEAS